MIKSTNIYVSSDQHKTLALISDIHYTKNYSEKRLEEVYENLKYNNPDYICIAGDFLDQGNVLEEKESREIFYNWIKKVAKIAPVIISIGNHDVGLKRKKWSYYVPKENIDQLNSFSNVHVLDNNSVVIDCICFLGYTLPFIYYDQKPHEQVEPYVSDIDQKLKTHLRKDYFHILLCHTPIYATHVQVCATEVLKTVDLVLSGHMHNGIIPFHGKGNYGLISPSKKIFPKYAWGNFKIDRTQYIISGGIIAFSKMSPFIFHFFNCFFPSHIEYIHL